MTNRGFTLVEAMIGVAMLGIACVAAYSAFDVFSLRAIAQAQETQAVLALESEVEHYLRGEGLSPQTRTALTQNLPGATMTSRTQGNTITFTLKWRAADGRHGNADLTVLRRSP
ncbi:MAG: prepilin-type N-terminal cleavage/methylation domain-containing protein [Myxococcota bacterium]